MNWDEFKRAAPELAALGEERIARSPLIYLGTLRANGFPRISPVEALFVDGELELGMMWRSPKALDLLRDPRCVVHNLVTKEDGTEGDFKLYGRARDLPDPGAWQRYCQAMFDRTGWRAPPSAPYHLFALDVEGAGFAQSLDGRHVRKAWRRE